MEVESDPYAEFSPAMSGLIKTCRQILELRAVKGPAMAFSFVGEDNRTESIISKRLEQMAKLHRKKSSDPGYHRHAVADFLDRYPLEDITSGMEDDWLRVEVLFSNPLPDVDTKGKSPHVEIYIGQFYHWAKSLDQNNQSKLVHQLLYHFYWVMSISTVGSPRNNFKKLSEYNGRQAGLSTGGGGDLKGIVRKVANMVQGLGIDIPQEGLDQMENMDLDSAFDGIAGWLDNSPMKGMITDAARGLQESEDQEGFVREQISKFLPDSADGLNQALDTMKQVGGNLQPPDF